MWYIVWYDWIYIIVSPNDAPYSFSNACFYGSHEPHLLRKKQEEDNLATTLLSVLCCRLREGYTIKVLNISVEVAASFVICTYVISVFDKASWQILQVKKYFNVRKSVLFCARYSTFVQGLTFQRVKNTWLQVYGYESVIFSGAGGMICKHIHFWESQTFNILPNHSLVFRL